MRDVHHPHRDEILLANVLHALSDPVRLSIVQALAGRSGSPCGALKAPVSKSTLSHHFKVLREAGVTLTRAQGTQRIVSLRTEDLETRFPGLLDSVLEASRVGVKRADGRQSAAQAPAALN